MKLVVGLGNPGRDYVGTRHNVGFELIDRLATSLGWTSKDADFDRQARSKFEGLAIDGPAAGGKALLLKPATYMNLSGRSVQAAMAFYQCTPADVLVVLDDIALPVGRLRLRGSGSSGGHNGLKDIERALGTNAYARLRIGIDPRPPQIPQVDYVLGRFTDEQRKTLTPTIDRAAEAAIVWMEKGIEPAMNRFNAGSEDK
ncbi:MAG TPA: aminoacyl-tRNA hydrolase [Tepidisphaeraceae bacterium]|jgi:PTH1 family peptidyl-tRNA hydrolase|nr:aminoacyl-tRNA hydrolase [Tepidisphaeraceae bacterium]